MNKKLYNFIRKTFYVVIFLFITNGNVWANLPTVLYDSDVKNYKKIFELQEKGRWADADKSIKKIKNDSLMGYVLYQRYMSPYYKTPFNEIKEWLNKYSDYPNAMDIYNLGLKKGAKKELKKPLKEASKTQYFIDDDYKNSYQMIQNSYKKLQKKDCDEVAYMIKIFNRRLKQGYTKNARQILENPHAKKLFKRDDYLRMEAYLAFAYFLANEDDLAILWGSEPAKELNFYLANWALGLSYWRKGDYKLSRDYFKNIAFTKKVPIEVLSAAAYWAWRANERIENSDDKDDGEIFLETASMYPKTFYGVLANKKLNKKLEINWEEPTLTLQNAREIISWQGGVRALALLQLDMKEEASSELKFLINTASNDYSDDLINAVLAVSEVAKMPHLSINVSNYKKEYVNHNTFATCVYPTIDVELKDGWSVDKALLNALIRQESRFNPKAKSAVGARGLMQIMPSTASFITKDSSLGKKGKSKLFDVELNLKIGQMYIEYLLAFPNINGNLFKFLLAYNAGPGNLKRQEERIINPENDPLFFIEAINLKESRIYIKRVMANFWIYRNKLNQVSESLDEIVNDRWPMYISKGDIPINNYTEEEIEYLEEYLEENEKLSETKSDDEIENVETLSQTTDEVLLDDNGNEVESPEI
ncbi:lytic transglycosylase domain-containing protein [bacterium]|nr:lytic transglycosylase domain-containing protein [bacterium]